MRRSTVHNETQNRDEYAQNYTKQTQTFAKILAPAAASVIKAVNGPLGYTDQVWALDYTRHNNEIETPLEFTDYFDDGLFPDTKPSHPSTHAI